MSEKPRRLPAVVLRSRLGQAFGCALLMMLVFHSWKVTRLAPVLVAVAYGSLWQFDRLMGRGSSGD